MRVIATFAGFFPKGFSFEKKMGNGAAHEVASKHLYQQQNWPESGGLIGKFA